jgi:ribosomal protein L40E
MMSSATSIDKVQLESDAASSRDVRAQPAQGGPDAGFKPWHFFVLVSLAASTVAVLMSRRSSPEHLILLSFTIGAAGVAAAAFYRMLAPLAVRDELLLSERPSERALAALEREKALVLRSIKELEFDRAMGKVSPKDFDEMAGRLRARALMLMKQIDAGGSGYREMIERELQARLKKSDPRRVGSSDQATSARSERALQACVSCGTTNDPDAAFCKRCGKSLAAVNQ